MASARYWKLAAIEVWTPGSALTLSDALLYESGVAQSGSVTCSVTPSSGALSNLSDADTGTSVSFSARDSFAPGFAITWDLGSAKDITKVGLRGPVKDNFPVRFELSYSTDGTTWVVYGKTFQSKWTDASTYYELDVANGNAAVSNTVVHMHCDSSAQDTGSASLSMNLVGSVTAIRDNTAFGGGSLLFNTAAQGGSIDNWLYSNSSVSSLSLTGEFTLYLRVCPFGYSGQWGCFLLDTQNGAGSNGFYLTYGNPALVNKFAFGFSGQQLISDAAPALNQWVEVMITRDASNVVRMFVAGVLQTNTATIAGASGASGFRMGRSYNDAGTTGICGKVDEVALINGVCLATTSYTPRTTPFADSLMGPTVVENELRQHPTSVVSAKRFVGPTVGNVQQSINVRNLNSIADNANGVGTITGTVKEKALPTNLPLSRKVRLLRERDGKCVRETWSDATTGAYTFSGLDVAQAYTAIAWDHLHTYRATVSDNLAATR